MHWMYIYIVYNYIYIFYLLLYIIYIVNFYSDSDMLTIYLILDGFSYLYSYCLCFPLFSCCLCDCKWVSKMNWNFWVFCLYWTVLRREWQRIVLPVMVPCTVGFQTVKLCRSVVMLFIEIMECYIKYIKIFKDHYLTDAFVCLSNAVWQNCSCSHFALNPSQQATFWCHTRLFILVSPDFLTANRKNCITWKLKE